MNLDLRLLDQTGMSLRNVKYYSVLQETVDTIPNNVGKRILP